MSRLLRIIFLATVIAALGQAVYHQAHLPAKVTAHFDLSGNANGWGERSAHIAGQITIILLVGVFFLGVGILSRRFPHQIIAIPHREYWLAPARRAKTMEVFSAVISACGLIVLGYLMLFYQQIYQVNVSEQTKIQLIPLMVAQFTLLTGLFILVSRRFRLPGK